MVFLGMGMHGFIHVQLSCTTATAGCHKWQCPRELRIAHGLALQGVVGSGKARCAQACCSGIVGLAFCSGIVGLTCCSGIVGCGRSKKSA